MATKQRKWTTEDKQRFADRNVLRAQTIPNKKALSRKQACRNRHWTTD